jgi:hypothetical protein
MGESWEKLKKWSKNDKWYRKSVFKMPILYTLPLVLAYWNFQSYDDGSFSDFLFNYMIFFLITWAIIYSVKKSMVRTEFRDKTERKIYRVLDKLLETHIDTLAARRSKYIHKDPFGKEVRDDWVEKGIMYFIDTQLRPRFSFYEQDRLDVEMDQIIDVIEEAVRSRNRRPRVVIDFSVTMDGAEYEQLCKEALEKLGWTVERTRADLREGVDLIAT